MPKGEPLAVPLHLGRLALRPGNPAQRVSVSEGSQHLTCLYRRATDHLGIGDRKVTNRWTTSTLVMLIPPWYPYPLSFDPSILLFVVTLIIIARGRNILTFYLRRGQHRQPALPGGSAPAALAPGRRAEEFTRLAETGLAQNT